MIFMYRLEAGEKPKGVFNRVVDDIYFHCEIEGWTGGKLNMSPDTEDDRILWVSVDVDNELADKAVKIAAAQRN